jgi:hypothetical protein
MANTCHTRIDNGFIGDSAAVAAPVDLHGVDSLVGAEVEDKRIGVILTTRVVLAGAGGGSDDAGWREIAEPLSGAGCGSDDPCALGEETEERDDKR